MEDYAGHRKRIRERYKKNGIDGLLDYEALELLLTYAVLSPRQFVENALKYKAGGIILVHNHPSGDCQPSAEDKRMTEDIVQACN